jgi:membrane protein YdbS with pleckstrin-like domain
MWEVTGWALTTWLKVTVVLSVGVGAAWLVWGAGSGPFWLAALGAGLLELYAIRQVGREWAYEARSSWWWSR